MDLSHERRKALLTPIGIVWLPAVWLFFWAVSGGMVACALYYLFVYGITPLTSAFGGASAAWGYITIRYYNQFNRWIDGDQVPPTQAGRYILRIEVSSNGGRTLTNVDVPPVAPDRLREMARVIVANGGLTSAIGERTFGSRSEYERFRASIIRAHWAEWRNPDNHQAGIDITEIGMDRFREIAEGGELIEIEEE